MTKVEFKSLPQYWFKEKIGLKRNTLRKFDKQDDIRKELLDRFRIEPFDLYIKIVNTKTSDYFMREISDVTIYEDWYIISWKDDLN